MHEFTCHDVTTTVGKSGWRLKLKNSQLTVSSHLDESWRNIILRLETVQPWTGTAIYRPRASRATRSAVHEQHEPANSAVLKRISAMSCTHVHTVKVREI